MWSVGSLLQGNCPGIEGPLLSTQQADRDDPCPNPLMSLPLWHAMDAAHDAEQEKLIARKMTTMMTIRNTSNNNNDTTKAALLSHDSHDTNDNKN